MWCGCRAIKVSLLLLLRALDPDAVMVSSAGVLKCISVGCLFHPKQMGLCRGSPAFRFIFVDLIVFFVLEPALVSLKMWKDLWCHLFRSFFGFDGARAFGFFLLCRLAGVGGSAARMVDELLVSGIFIVVSAAPVMDFRPLCGFHLGALVATMYVCSGKIASFGCFGWGGGFVHGQLNGAEVGSFSVGPVVWLWCIGSFFGLPLDGGISLFVVFDRMMLRFDAWCLRFVVTLDWIVGDPFFGTGPCWPIFDWQFEDDLDAIRHADDGVLISVG
ncbi:hypothetical protein Nepgr_022913 [Nepenthes gracilis]|uniref:Uncharacterized protein n=1 Tax=Nepenthes gracilis TaxID=150966 RepID=A0AAD3T1T8_NEPGR|nr:hypothetical protein Nepgr_022913 [Nepenthes gracilis]